MTIPFDTDNFPCTKCTKHFPTHAQQSSHLHDVHDAENPWLCLRCPHTSATKALHDQHMSTQHNDTKAYYTCPRRRVCALATPTKDMMDRHLRYDHAAEPCCPTCGFANESRLGVSMHVLHEHAHRCVECGEGFETEGKLRSHTYTQHTLPAETEAEARQAQQATLSLETDGHGAAKAFVDALTPEALDAIIAIESGRIHATPTSIDLVGLPTPSTTATPEAIELPQQKWPTVSLAPTPEHPQGQQHSPPPPPPRHEYPRDSPSQPHTSPKPSPPPTSNPQTIYLGRNLATPHTYRHCPPQIPDSILFHAEPRMLAYGNLLRLAETHSNAQIMELANAGRPEPVFRIDGRWRGG
ncbi:hypothetical protein LTR78_000453 [Recurvomyces mirabilis]|uniref:C2H2-type domain-containing protein n=1 Tax=Recurvomyces mirabilis TaxID=574656 RepID=A0AAE1C6K7_9PEZI|nr:hypothetical protein LTR78_000453 [Recurvomyces mirabilis]KAK5162108.1 hypothetical protein LTS14_000454 [Recurvomyces mirabilis]